MSEPQKGSPAAEAGIKSGDVVTAVNGTAVEGTRDLSRDIAALGPDHKVDLTVWHDGASRVVPVTLGTLPGDEARAEPATGRDTAEIASLGLTLVPASAVPGRAKDGATVVEVDPEGAAARKGLNAGDVILRAAETTVTRPSDVTAAFEAAKKDGRPVLLRVGSGRATTPVSSPWPPKPRADASVAQRRATPAKGGSKPPVHGRGAPTAGLPDKPTCYLVMRSGVPDEAAHRRNTKLGASNTVAVWSAAAGQGAPQEAKSEECLTGLSEETPLGGNQGLAIAGCCTAGRDPQTGE